MEKIEIRKSKNGLGIFSINGFSSKEVIFEVKGSFISCYEEDDIDEKTRANTFRFDEEKYLSPEGEIGDFLNHSCNPNSTVLKNDEKLFVVAVNDIGKNEEVTIDYSTIIALDDSWEMKCNCGSNKCRNQIGTFDSLPKEIKHKYVLLNMVPEYILGISES
jgi:SET domain-containing protein